MKKTVFIGIPVHDGKIHVECVAGMLQTIGKIPCQFDTAKGSFLPKNRDTLTAAFLDSEATHFMCLDSDIGFVPSDIQTLLDSDVDFVSGIYVMKNQQKNVPARLANENSTNGLLEAISVPAGFMLLSRSCVERMVGAYRKLEYATEQGIRWGLWSTNCQLGIPYTSEDGAFCKRWRDIGGNIYINPGVIVRHYGDYCYLPDSSGVIFLK